MTYWLWPEFTFILMNIASWNCRGASGRAFHRINKDIVRKNNLGILCLLEPRISGSRADNVVRRLGFSNWVRVKASGFAWGIWVLWDARKFQFEYVASMEQFILCQVTIKSSNKGFFAMFVYSETTYLKRKALWEAMVTISKSMTDPLVILGDFNAYRWSHNKEGG